jgi:cytochrome b pre-mRNA-processing protein 3
MLDFLFRRLTAQPSRGRELFEALIAQARDPHWYVEGTVPDTLDGRFAVLATVNALLLVRLEDEGEAGNQLSVALTERFIEVMESEHRELGMGDPTLGRTVRKLVGSLSRRTDLWRAAVKGDADWAATARGSLYKEGVAPDALRHSAGALERIWSTLQAADFAQIAAGDMR